MTRESHYGCLEMEDTQKGKHCQFRVIETITVVTTFEAHMPGILSGALAFISCLISSSHQSSKTGISVFIF